MRKIYVDYLRNAKRATAIAAYSTRAKPGAPVSAPLSWDEVSVDSTHHYTVAKVPDRLRGLRHDPGQDCFAVKEERRSKLKSSLT